jgi:RNA polymerase sigma-54 factor
MRPSLHQSVSLKQEMRMNPRLYQAMDLLYMPLLDLQQHLKTELLENPFLEMVETEEEPDGAREKTAEEQERERAEQEKQDEIDWEEIVLDGFDVGRSRGEVEVSEAYQPLQAATRNLTDHLRDQITLLNLTPRQHLLAEEFLGSIGDDGYLQQTVEEVVEGANHLLNALRDMEPPVPETAVAPIPEGHPLASQVLEEGTDGDVQSSETAPSDTTAEESDDPYTVEEGEELLRVLQQLDPPGIAARDLRECLLLQLENDGQQDTLTYRLVQVAFEDLIGHRWSDLAKRFGLEPKAVQDAADLLAKLDPKPGLQYSAGDNVYVTPDMVVEKVDGEYRVFLNDGGMPQLRISKIYRELAGDKKKFVGESKEFVTNKLNSATWLIQAIEQRRQTMLKVMNFIIDRQRDYFEKGVEHLKPLTLREVADVISMHESTVSRVTNQKYVQTPRGVLPLKFFFSSSLGTTGGEDASARAVKAQIQKLVGDENSTKPLTDSDIVKALAERGIKIARRTVAKYRDQLNILPARMRKRV